MCARVRGCVYGGRLPCANAHWPTERMVPAGVSTATSTSGASATVYLPNIHTHTHTGTWRTHGRHRDTRTSVLSAGHARARPSGPAHAPGRVDTEIDAGEVARRAQYQQECGRAGIHAQGPRPRRHGHQCTVLVVSRNAGPAPARSERHCARRGHHRLGREHAHVRRLHTHTQTNEKVREG
jgi:hypothetical protein